MSWTWASSALLILLAACPSREKNPPPAAAEPAVTASAGSPTERSDEGKALLSRFECNRCHEGTGLGAPPSDKQCVGCHQKIQSGELQATPEALAKWKENLHSLPVVPSLASTTLKLRRDWVRAQLLDPADARPALPATMPRMRISREEAETLSMALVPHQAPPETFPELSVTRGAAIFEQLSCNACHAFGSAPAQPRAVSAELGQPSKHALLLAPNLALTRERFQSGRLVSWLMNPEATDPDTLMPNFKLSATQASSLAAYIWYSKLTPARAQPLPKRLPPLERAVGWDEVFGSVFKTVCWHCHSASDLARGDGGVGNTGGFGFAAKGLDLSSYESIRSGSFGPDGKRRSIFVKDPSGTSLLVRHMLARQVEVRGEDAELLGMPLGFPPMTAEQIQLVESWIAQGRPR